MAELVQATSATRCPGRWEGLRLPPGVRAAVQAHIARRPLRPEAWARLLPAGYHDTEFLLYVLEHGLPIVPPGTVIPPGRCKNYASTREYAQLVEQQLHAELADHQLLRQPTGGQAAHIHALAAIPKSPPPVEEVRVIHDLSRPAGQAVNDYITYKHYTWASLDDALRMVTPNCFMARVDIRQYYRHIPIDPADWPLTAFEWHFQGEAGPTVLWDPYLQFGQRNAPEVAHRFTMAILATMQSQGHSNIVGIVDDFLVVAPTEEACRATWLALIDTLQQLGFCVNMKPGKTDPPSQLVKFVGVHIDSRLMQVRLCPDKLRLIQGKLDRFNAMRSARRQELQSLAGLLNWACKVVYGGRTFMRRLIDIASTPVEQHRHVKLSSDARADITWWRQNLPKFNGHAVILPAKATTPLEFQTDAESTGAVGVFIMGGYAGLTRHQLEADCAASGAYLPPAGLHICVYETFAVLVAVRLFPEAFRNGHFCVRSDNTQTVAAIRKGTCNAPLSKQHMMRILRELFQHSVQLNFRLTATHIPGFQNAMADALSRQQWSRFASLLKAWRQQARHVPTQVQRAHCTT